jgi:ribosomal protein S12 methylthiotransferase
VLKFKVISLGCAKNLVDSEVITGILDKAGYVQASGIKDAEILVVNTCGFITEAKEESVNAILEAAQYKIKGSCRVLIAVGCLAQSYHDELLQGIPEIDGLLGVGELSLITEITKNAVDGKRTSHVGELSYLYDHNTPRILSTPFYSAYIKVADGCNNKCSYCAIPQIRGEYRSRTMDSVVSEATRLVSRGVKEVNLIAQDTTRYGFDIYGEYTLDQLLRKLCCLDGLSWLRVLYAYPTRFTDRLIETIASYDKICKYIDIPLQHADDLLLQVMNRQGTAKDILGLIERLRKVIPDITLRTSFIVGFPGETEEQFQTLLDFVETVRFDKVGVFTYSPEEGTVAEILPNHVPEEVKEERKDLLMRVQQKISLEKNTEKIGKIVYTLIEGKDKSQKEIYFGRTEADAPEVDGIITVKGMGLQTGDIVRVKVTHAYEYDLIGEVIE